MNRILTRMAAENNVWEQTEKAYNRAAELEVTLSNVMGDLEEYAKELETMGETNLASEVNKTVSQISKTRETFSYEVLNVLKADLE